MYLTQIINGEFQDCFGNRAANGYITLELSADAVALAPDTASVAAGKVIQVSLDANGNVPSSPAVFVAANDKLNPANSYYTMKVYLANGQLFWGPHYVSILYNGGMFDLGSIVPSSSVTSGIGGVGSLTSDDGSISIVQSQAGATDITVANVANVKHFGNALTGSGKQNYAGAMASASNVLNLRLGTQSNPNAPISGGQLFTPDDVGKSILVSGPNGGAGASSIVNLYTTITAVNSSTQAVLASAAPTGGIATNFSGQVYWWNSAQDDTAAIQAAINACDGFNQYAKVYLPAGVYIRTGTLTNSLNMKEMYGDGIKRTVILTPNANVANDALYFTDQVYFKMKGMTWRGPGQDAAFGGRLRFDLFVESVLFGLSFEDVEVAHVAFDGMYMNTPILTTFRNCLFNFTAGNGITLNTAVATTFDSCYFITNLLAGVNMQNCAALTFNSCAAESNGIGYYANSGTWSIAFNGCDSEFQTKRTASAPASFPSVTVSAGGSVATGTYRFKYTWLRRVTSNATPLESLPSPDSSPVTVTTGNQTVSFTIPAAPTDVPFINFANVYVTNGATGTETFLGLIGLNPSAATTVTYNTPIAGDGVAHPPLTSMIGHHYAIENAQNITLNSCTCNTVPNLSTDPRFLIVTGASSQVSARQLRLIQQLTPNPAFWIELDAAAPYGGNAPSQIWIESGDITASQVSIGSGVTGTTLNLSGVLQVPNLAIASGNAPATSSSAGTAGTLAWDSSGNWYLCVATNTWKRVALSSF